MDTAMTWRAAFVPTESGFTVIGPQVQLSRYAWEFTLNRQGI
jgi:hypothetical protein